MTDQSLETEMAVSVFTNLDLQTAQDEAQFYRDSGADAEFRSDAAGQFTLTVTFPDDPAPASAPTPAVQAPTKAGYVLCIDRLRCELRPGIDFPRTVGVYQAYMDGVPIPKIRGFCVERQGPGDNTASGVANHRRIEAGSCPLFTHAGSNGRYDTLQYAKPGALPRRPWPCLGVEKADERSGILIHCASGYLMSIGCISLAADVADESTNLNFADSWQRVTRLIDSIRQSVAGFPGGNNKRIPTATLLVRGEPDLEVASDINEQLKSAILTALRMNEIGDASPYQLSFAGKGKSGASFGAMQGDLAAKQQVVENTFHDVLEAAGFDPAEIQNFLTVLSVPRITNPLSMADTKRINDALNNSRSLVDAMDRNILAGVLAGVDQCIGAASGAGRHVEAKALIYMALWINMSGPPSKLLTWLAGGDPGMLGAPVLGAAVTASNMENYLRATRYFHENPGNLPHILQSAAAGAQKLS
jgi:hypothetical protein